jgi:tRNA G10  N-methylase Trm11
VLTWCAIEALPLRNEAVDVVLCDLPFGRKFQVGGAADLVRLYCAFAVEALRVLRSRGRYLCPAAALLSRTLCALMLSRSALFGGAGR